MKVKDITQLRQPSKQIQKALVQYLKTNDIPYTRTRDGRQGTLASGGKAARFIFTIRTDDAHDIIDLIHHAIRQTGIDVNYSSRHIDGSINDTWITVGYSDYYTPIVTLQQRKRYEPVKVTISHFTTESIW